MNSVWSVGFMDIYCKNRKFRAVLDTKYDESALLIIAFSCQRLYARFTALWYS